MRKEKRGTSFIMANFCITLVLLLFAYISTNSALGAETTNTLLGIVMIALIFCYLWSTMSYSALIDRIQELEKKQNTK